MDEQAAFDHRYFDSPDIPQSCWPPEKVAAIKSPTVKEHAEVFRSALTRAFLLHLLPFRLVMSASRGQNIFDQAELELLGTLNPRPDVRADPSFQQQVNVKAEQIDARMLRDGQDMDRWGQLGVERTNHIFTHGFMVQPAVIALLTTQVVSSWTAFEVLANDLWGSTVNIRPLTLGRKVISAQIKTGDDNKGPRPISPERLVQLQMQHGFNLSNKLGDIVRREQRGAFNRLAGLRAYYELTFGIDAGKLFDRHPYLATLEALRNVLVHRNGQIDQQFVDRAANTEFASLRVDDRLHLNGEIAGKCAKVVSEFGSDLVEYVDRWLSDNVEYP